MSYAMSCLMLWVQNAARDSELTYIQLSELSRHWKTRNTQVPPADFFTYYIPIIFLIPLRTVIQNPPIGGFVMRFHCGAKDVRKPPGNSQACSTFPRLNFGYEESSVSQERRIVPFALCLVRIDEGCSSCLAVQRRP